MASTFPLAPANGAVHYVSGTSYTYNSAVGWVRSPSPVTTLPADGAGFTSGLAQFTQPIFQQSQVFENPFDAWLNNTGVLRRLNTSGTLPAWDTTSYVTTLWGGQNMLRITPTNTGMNFRVDVPAWASIVWMRFINSDVATARENNVYFRWNSETASGAGDMWSTHFWSDNLGPTLRSGPFGHPMYDYNGETSINHIWHPITVPPGGGTLFGWFRSDNNAPDGWVSGLAFTDNPQGWTWANAIHMHREQSALNGFSARMGLPGRAAPTWQGLNNGLTRVAVPFGNGFTIANATNFSMPVVNNGLGKRLTFVVETPGYGDGTDTFMVDVGGVVKGPTHIHSPIDWLTLSIRNSQTHYMAMSFDFTAAEIATATLAGAVPHVFINWWSPYGNDGSISVAQAHLYDI